MSAIRSKLTARLQEAATQKRGVKITAGYSPTWKNEANKLVAEGKAEFRGGKLFLKTAQPK